MTFTAPHPEPTAPDAGASRLGRLPPPAGPRLDPPASSRAARPVDWWGWQARVRAATGSARVSVRPRSTATRTRWAAVALPVVLGVLAVGGVGAVVVGRQTGEPARAAAPRGATAAETAVVSAIPPALVGVTDLPAPLGPPPSSPDPTPTPPPPAGSTRPTYPVVRTTVDVIDPTRPAVDRGDGATPGGRLIRTVVRLPDATAARPFPLVVFAHGYATSTAAYGPLLDDLAAAGYVVAAPELPMTSTAYGTPVGAREPLEQVEDVRRVITEVTAAARADGPDGPDGPLRGAVGDGPVVVVGHSDGGMTAAAIAFSAGRRDDRIGAAVVLSGARLADGDPWFPTGGPALLAVHGDADEVNPFAASQALYAADRSGSARFLVRVRDGGHIDAFLSPRTRPALVALVDDFIRATVGADADAAARLRTDAAVPGVLDLVGGESGAAD